MSSFNLKELLIDSLILGNIISNKKISFFDQNIQSAALEKSVQLFKNIPSLGKSREQYTVTSANPIGIGTIISYSGHIPLLKNRNGTDVAYIETQDISGGKLSNIENQTDFKNVKNIKKNNKNNKKYIKKHKKSIYKPELSIETVLEYENEVAETENLVNAKKIVDIIKSTEDPDSLALFIDNNLSYIRELLPIIRKLADDKKIERNVIESLLLHMNKK